MSVRWQVSQSFELAGWLGDLPIATRPLWHWLQPLEIPAWSKSAPAQRSVVWQSSHPRDVGMWLSGLLVVVISLALL